MMKGGTMSPTSKQVNSLYIIQVLLAAAYLAVVLIYAQIPTFQEWTLNMSRLLADNWSIVINLLPLLIAAMGIRTAVRHKTSHGYVFLALSVIYAGVTWLFSYQIIGSYYWLLLTLFLIYLVQGAILYGHYLVCLNGCPISYN